ncbi:uracil-DNA glycosylase [Riemerella anatipestifer]|uniref:Uracil-DNA glycosylase n=2 Tax=Riemerella anatipestifer TaxID=34085 RepID=E4TDK6_RIEAD|nr:uracil-DNA glycosylase [Riemerella anatipestifer]ADQ82865.1 Uracil-DNA glycosylase [Riemerella anatipestifer ATCC 11845 = DSM 15868]ADZ11640.1 Uracil DNA glycosylase [Riemerella anatipestifer RA-GD]AFD56877.1 uracil-DNA glycosylase [Riemerella anatipestifer ATCC 11845 = DSM 15868]AGC41179.1 Uracil DNA glycosylase [Riemerella anatipestifer RA-CH-2]AIH01758.1 uracil-DNA glycosylase [Riemerella anatipestifer CH3]
MTWTEVLAPIKNSSYFKNLWQKVKQEYHQYKCFPPKEQIFRAIELTPFEEVKVVILGQDPYHNDFQANGLCFSVSDQVPAPPSLRNIFKELQDDLGIIKTSNKLDSWAKQGVLLLNATLTVKAHEANSHKDLGWETFTDFIIKEISDKKENIVFVLWGSFAQKKAQFIDAHKHYIIKTAHPSPLSAHRGFLGSKPFSKINNYLLSKNKEEIKW